MTARFVRALLSVAPFLLVASTAHATAIHYELVIELVPGYDAFLSSGGPSFDDATFTPNGVVAATGFDFSHAFYEPVTFSLAGCTSLEGYVNASGSQVVALSGTCVEDRGASYGTVTFYSDNTAYIEILPGVLALNAVYTVPEPGGSWLGPCIAAFAWRWRRRRA